MSERSEAGLRAEVERLCARLLGAGAAAAGTAAGVLETPGCAARRPALVEASRACVAQLRRAGSGSLHLDPGEAADLEKPGPPRPVALTAEELARALAALPRAEAALLTLRYQAELDYDDLARLFDVERDRIGPLLLHARRALRARLATGGSG